jgi:lactate permease
MGVLNFLLALLPILWLGFALIALKIPAYKAALGSLVIAGLLAAFFWKLSLLNTVTAGLEGFLMALWPIILVILAAVFTYRLSLHTGSMDIIKQMITSVCSDRRVLVLLIAWCFGGFMEGMAGFGTAIAIPASMLVSLGFDPIFSCLVCLIANGTPTPFGSIGIPTVTLANVVGLESTGLAFMTTAQLCLFMLACPFLIVMAAGKGVKGLKGMIPITAASGLSFVIPQLIVSKFIGAELAVVIGSVSSLLVTILLGRKKAADPEYELKVESNLPLMPSGHARPGCHLS